MSVVSIMIVTYNSGDAVMGCLRSIPLQAGAHTVEVIVTDNGSGDGTPECIQREFPQVKLVRAENRGFGAGNNRAFEASSGDYVMCVNPDVVLKPGAVEALVAALADETIGIVAPRIRDNNGQVSMTARPVYTPLRVFLKYVGVDVIAPALVYGKFASQGAFTRPTDADWVSGACMAMRREVYAQLGGFDERFFLYFEDVDIGRRTRELGLRVVVLPDVTVMHHGNTTIGRYPLVRTRSYHLSPLDYFRKHGQPNAARLLKVGFTLELLAKIALRLVRRSPARARAEWQVLREMWRY